MTTIRIDVEGKYTFEWSQADYRVYVKRHGDPWLTIDQGSGAVLALMQHCLELSERDVSPTELFPEATTIQNALARIEDLEREVTRLRDDRVVDLREKFVELKDRVSTLEHTNNLTREELRKVSRVAKMALDDGK